MDHFLEEIIVLRKRAINELLYYVGTAAMALFALIGFWMLTNLLASFSVPILVMTAVSLGVGFLLYLYKDRLRTEFEYTFTNGDLDFAQVYNNKKRKNLGTMRVKNVEAFGSVAGDPFRKLINMPGLVRKNWFLNRDANLYYFYYQKDGAKTVIVLEPSVEMVEMIKKYLPHGVFQR